jgi:hypothetical protein
MPTGRRTLTAAWPRCCSQTSSARRRKPTSLVIAAGGICSVSITPASGICWSGSAAARSTPGSRSCQSAQPKSNGRGPAATAMPRSRSPMALIHDDQVDVISWEGLE